MRFEVRSELGRGGEGRVLEVFDRARGEVVALKEARGPRRQALSDEFRLLHRLRHPHLVAVHDFFGTSPVDPDASAYTLERVDGLELLAALRADPQQIQAITDALLQGLAQLHLAGVAHLDLKPDNVLVARGSSRVRLIDFGIAHPLGEPLTRVFGSRSYIAPELAEGVRVAASADLFGLGVLLAECLFAQSGRTGPVAAPSEVRALAEAPLDQRRLAIGEAARAAERPWLSPIVELASRCLEPDPTRRPADAAEAAKLYGAARRHGLSLVGPGEALALARSGGLVAREHELEAATHRIERALPTFVVGEGRASFIAELVHRAQLAGRPAERWPLTDPPTTAGFVAALERVGRLRPLGVALDAEPELFARALLEALTNTAHPPETPRLAGLLGVTRTERAPLQVSRFLETLASAPESPLPLALVIASNEAPASASLALPPANEAAVRAFVQSRFGAFPTAEPLVRWLHAAAAGRFGELEGLCELLVARGLLTMGPGGWAVGPLDEVVVRGRIPERLAAFSPNARAVVRALALLNARLPKSLLTAVLSMALDLGEPEARRAEDELELAGWLEGDGLAPVISAALTPELLEVGLEASPDFGPLTQTSAATALNDRLMRALAGLSDPSELPPALAARVLAFSEGGLAGAALLVPAIAERLASYRVEEAKTLTALGLSLLRPEDNAAAVRLALLRQASRVADLLGPREAQRDALTALLQALPDGDIEYTDTGPPGPDTVNEALEVRAKLFWTKTRIGDPSFVGEGEVLRARAAALGRFLLSAEVGVHLAIAATQRGELDAAEALLGSAAAAVQAAGRSESDPERLGLMARIANNLGNVALYRHDQVKARDHYQEALALKRRQGDPVGERIALGNLALVELDLGAPKKSLTALIESRAIARRTGHRRGEAWSLLTMAELGLECGALDYAIRRAGEAARIAEALGDTLVHSDALATLAEARLAQRGGAPDHGVCELAQRASALAEAGGNRWTALRAAVIGALAGTDAEPGLEDALEAALADKDGDPATRRLAAQHLVERRFARGEFAIADHLLAPLTLPTANPGRVGLRAANAWRTGLRTLQLVDRQAADRHARHAQALLSRWLENLPQMPLSDGVDDESAVDGPALASARSASALLALGTAGPPLLDGPSDGPLDGPPRGWEDGGPGGVASALTADLPMPPQSGAPMSSGQVPLELALGDVEALSRIVSEALTALVLDHGAERGFLVDFGASPPIVMDARDPDGEALSGGLKRLPEVALEAAARTTTAWRGADGRGALCIVPAHLPLGSERRHLALVLQNRFVAEAFADPNTIAADTGALFVAARLILFGDALAHLAKERDEAAQRVHAVERETTEEIRALRRELESTREQLGPTHAYKGIVYTSGAMKRMLRQVDRVVTTELPVHIHGESGTGKELIAHAIHDLGPRGRGPFVPQNCTAIPPTLFESELFGHERGSFTGAVRSAEGLFRRAHLGTLFLDEIGDLPLELQAKLLRVLETGEVRPVGATRSVKVDVRVVSATHRDLKELIAKGLFREDLYYRLNVIRIEIPPLRERPEDIPLLARHFLASRDPSPRHFDEAAMKALVRFAWPGNVRQLENEVSRAALLADGEAITVSDLSPEVAGRAGGDAGSPQTGRAARPDASNPAMAHVGFDLHTLSSGPLKDRVDHLETIALRNALESTGHNKSEVARVLGLSRAGLNLKLKRLGLWDGE